MLERPALPTQVDVLVIGAGFAGLCALHQLSTRGFSVHAVDSAAEIGGVWFANQYPGARCDVESVDYCYSFDASIIQEWQWTERYPAQQEILAYIRFVADQLDLRRNISLNTQVLSLTFDADANTWRAVTDDDGQLEAKHVVMATGQLSAPLFPDIPGIEDFAGQTVMTARWPSSIDLTGKRVGVIGTGSSGVQAIPQLAKVAEELFVFQRTPHYIVPAMNHALDEDDAMKARDGFTERRAAARRSPAGMSRIVGTASAFEVSDEEFEATMNSLWAAGGPNISIAYRDIRSDVDAAEKVGDFVRRKIRQIVKDPVTAEKLCPRGYPYGTKRLVLEIDYYETYNRPNVHLVDVLSHPIESVTKAGIRTDDGEYPLDVLVFATGFEALTGALNAIEITGLDGVTLKEKYAPGPKAHLGITTAGFPNMYFVAQSGTPSVLANVVVAIEQHIEWITDLLCYIREHSFVRADVDVAEEEAWDIELGELIAKTLFPQGKSWYLGDNVKGKSRPNLVYFGGLDRYSEVCDAVAADGYRGYVFT